MKYVNFFSNSAVETHGRASQASAHSAVETHGRASQFANRASQASAHSNVETHGRASLAQTHQRASLHTANIANSPRTILHNEEKASIKGLGVNNVAKSCKDDPLLTVGFNLRTKQGLGVNVKTHGRASQFANCASLAFFLALWLIISSSTILAQPNLPSSGNLAGEYVAWNDGNYPGPYTMIGNVIIRADYRYLNNNPVIISGNIGSLSSNYTLTKYSYSTFYDLRLTGNNTYTGETIINFGDLSIGNNGTTGNINGNIWVANGAYLSFRRSNDYTYSGVISGQGGVDKLAAGAVYLTGNNTYIGNTNIFQGMLAIGNNTTTGSIQPNAVFLHTASAAISFRRSNDYTFNANISGQGMVSKGGTGNLYITGALTNTGPTIVGSGSLYIGNNGTTGSITGNITVDGNATLRFNRSDAYTYSGVIGGQGDVVKLGNSDLFLTGNNTITAGTLTVSSGHLYLGNNSNSGSWAGNITVLENATLRFYRSNDYTYSGVISGAGDVYQYSFASLTLNGNNTYTGTTIIDGSLILGTNGSIAQSAGVRFRIYNNMMLTIQGNKTVKAINHSSGATTFGTIVLGANTLTIGTSATTNDGGGTFSGVISGTGGITKTGTQTLYLTGANTYSGTTTINAGALSIGNNTTTGSIASNSVWVNAGTLIFNRSNDLTYSGLILGMGAVQKLGAGTLTFTDNNAYVGGTTISNGTLQLGNGGTTGDAISNITNNAALIFNRSNDLTYSSIISGTGSVTKTGAGMLTFTKENTYTGTTTISNGTLRIGNGATGSVAGNIVNNAALVVNRTGSWIYSRDISGTGTFTKQQPGTLILTGNNTHTGTKTVSAGTLQIGNGGTTGSITGNITNNGTITFNRSNAYTYSGIISGLGNVNKDGNGTLTLSATNTSTGTLYCNTGTLILSGNWAGNLVKLSTSTLTVTGNRTIGGTLNMQGGNTNFNLSATTPSRLSATGALSTSGTNTLNITSIGTASSYILISAASGVATTNFTTSGSAGTLSATTTQLTFTPAPAHVPVTDITNIPTETTATIPITLTGTVVPSNATNQEITWSVQNAGTTGANITNDNVLNTTAAGSATIRATIVNGLTPTTPYTKDVVITVAQPAWPPDGMIGSGTEEDPWQIETHQHLKALADFVNEGYDYGNTTAGKYYLLINNLDLSSYQAGEGWQTIGYRNSYLDYSSFKGNFNGNNKTISNLKINRNKDCIGLFGRIVGATIENLGLIDVYIENQNSFNGSLVGYMEGSIVKNCYSENCYVDGNVHGSTGGLIGGAFYNCLIQNCYANGEVFAASSVGGLIGYLEGDDAIVENCYSEGTVSATECCAGGFMGYSEGFSIVKNCYSTANVNAGDGVAGGFIGGPNYLTMENCYASGNVQGDEIIGGFVGYNQSSIIKNCVAANASVVSNLGLNVNRMMGYSNGGTITNNYALETMLVNGSTVSSSDLTSLHGADVTIAQLQSRAFFETASNWDGDAWSIEDEPSSVWNICDTYTFPWLQWENIICTEAFIPVTDITDIPTAATAFLPLTLTGTVVPSDATNQNIVWSVQNAGTTGANITDDIILNTTGAGTLTIRATIENGDTPTTPFINDVVINVTMATLSGTVSISGNAVFGETLTANTEYILTSTPPIPDLGTLSYQWRRGTSNISGAIYDNYTLTQDDIGYEIDVVVSAENCTGDVTSSPTSYIEKAQQEEVPDEPTLNYTTAFSIVLNSVSGCEYNINDGTWQTSPIFAGLTPETTYSFKQRLAETATHLASPESSAATFTTDEVINPVYVITATAGANGEIDPSGDINVEEGDNQTFYFYPDSGYDIDVVYIDGSSNPEAVENGNHTFVYVTEDHTIHVTFKAQDVETYTITATSGANGSIDPSGTVIVNSGDNQTFYFYPDAGYETEQVLVNGYSVPEAVTDGFYTFVNVDEDHTIHVTFAVKTLVITATAGENGSIDPLGTVYVNGGENQTFTFTPYVNYLINQVFVDGENVPEAVENGYHTFVNVTEDHTIHVTFVAEDAVTYTITASAGTNGTIDPSGDIIVEEGDSQTFLLIPDVGYQIEQVLINGVNDPDAVEN